MPAAPLFEPGVLPSPRPPGLLEPVSPRHDPPPPLAPLPINQRRQMSGNITVVVRVFTQLSRHQRSLGGVRDGWATRGPLFEREEALRVTGRAFHTERAADLVGGAQGSPAPREGRTRGADPSASLSRFDADRSTREVRAPPSSYSYFVCYFVC